VGSGVAADPSISIAVTAGAASGTGQANGVSPDIAPSAGASGTGVANGSSVEIDVNAAVATGTGSAYDATVSTASMLQVDAGQATGTGAANDPSVSIAVNAGLASGTGQAYDATVTTTASLSVTAGSASGLGAAFDATVIIAVGAGFAAGTGQAYDATISATTGGAAGGWGKLQAKRKRAARLPQPVRAPTLVYALAETATGYGQAFDATVRIDWTLDEWLLGLTDDQLIDTATRGGVA
jgi:hypothetical protein